MTRLLRGLRVILISCSTKLGWLLRSVATKWLKKVARGKRVSRAAPESVLSDIRAPEARQEKSLSAPLQGALPPLQSSQGRRASRLPLATFCCAFGATHSIQSAMKTLVSPRFLAFRFEAKTSFLPSGENMGKPSKVSWSVMRSRPLPSTLIW